jgi:hypothetical protein
VETQSIRRSDSSAQLRFCQDEAELKIFFNKAIFLRTFRVRNYTIYIEADISEFFELAGVR